MNDEIKEILDFIKEQIEKETLSYEPDVELSKQEAKLLLDYITNLQQENERLKEYQDGYRKEIDYWRIQFGDYKSKIKKAVEYIKEAIENDEYFEDDIATDISEPSYDKYVNSNNLLNILQNGSDASVKDKR